MVAGHAEGRAVDHHVPHQPQRVQDPRATVHQIAEEHRLAALGMPRRSGAPDRIVVVPLRAGS